MRIGNSDLVHEVCKRKQKKASVSRDSEEVEDLAMCIPGRKSISGSKNS